MKNIDKFLIWFKTNLKVRAYLNITDLNNKYIIGDTQIIINLTDNIQPRIYNRIKELSIEYFWFPMNESSYDIGLNSIYGACAILHYAERENKNVILHCWGGNNRSQTVAQAYYFARTGQHLISEYKGFDNQLIYNCEKGFLPSRDKMEKFLIGFISKKENEIIGGGLDDLKLQIAGY